MIGYLIEAIRPLVLILPKMSGYIKIFKDEFGDKNNKLISLHIDDDKILKKYIKISELCLKTYEILN